MSITKTPKLKPFLLLLAMLLSCGVFAQEDFFGIDTKVRRPKSNSGIGNVTRNAISAISLDVSGGMGFHLYNLDFQSTNPSLFPISSLTEEGNPAIVGLEEPVTFRQNNFAFPVNAAVKIDLFGIATIGGGYGREWGRMTSPTFEEYTFNFSSGAYTFDRLYGSFGLIIYDARKRASFLNWRYRKYSGNNHYMQAERKLRLRQNYPWRFILEGEYGTITIRDSFDPYINAADPFYGVGLRVEMELSEYVKVYAKPNFEMRRFSYDNPEIAEPQLFNQQMLTVNAGIAIRMPGTKRCRVSGCGVKMKHIHDGVEYRGSSIFNMQDRRVGQW
jgi:hypothetical protein